MATLGYSEAQVRWVLNWALTHHVSLINNKSRDVPARFRPLVDEYLSFAGPRLMVVRATRVGQLIQLEDSNRGTPPPYAAWHFAVRVGDTAVRFVGNGGFLVPAGLTGPVAVTLLDERDQVIHLANEGVGADGWLQLFLR